MPRGRVRRDRNGVFLFRSPTGKTPNPGGPVAQMTAILGLSPRYLPEFYGWVIESYYHRTSGVDRERDWLKKHRQAATQLYGLGNVRIRRVLLCLGRGEALPPNSS
jgi:hypothetical protein